MNNTIKWTAGRSFSAYVGTYDFAKYSLKLSNNSGVIDFNYAQAKELLELLPEALEQLRIANNLPEETPNDSRSSSTRAAPHDGRRPNNR